MGFALRPVRREYSPTSQPTTDDAALCPSVGAVGIYNIFREDRHGTNEGCGGGALGPLLLTFDSLLIQAQPVRYPDQSCYKFPRQPVLVLHFSTLLKPTHSLQRL